MLLLFGVAARENPAKQNGFSQALCRGLVLTVTLCDPSAAPYPTYLLRIRIEYILAAFLEFICDHL